MNVGKFSVSNPVLINICMIAILFLGLLSFSHLPRELMSDVAFCWVFIAVPYPGVSAGEIEKNVTIEIEEEVSDVERIKRISSTTRDGICFIQIEFEDDISESEFARRAQEVRTEFDKVELPDGTLDPWIEEFSTSDFAPIVTVNITGAVDADIINRAAKTLRDRLLDVPDISKVEIIGGRDREICVQVDRNRMEAYGLSLNEIAGALRFRNMNVPGGTLEVGNRAYIIQTLGEIEKTEDFGTVIIRRRPGGGSIKIADVAAISDGYAESEYDARVNGEKTVSLFISKKVEGSSIDVVDDVREVVAGFRETMHPGLALSYFNDSTIWIRDILNKLGTNSMMGFALLILVLFLFLGFRNSLITALGIPMTFAITFIFMEWRGESLNGNSLFGLVLVLGMIVDHAIVIMENSYRHRQLGLSPREAAVSGTNEVVKPVIAATLTTIAAFLPLMLLPGIMGKFMRIIPIVVSLALVASTLEALVFLPVHFADWGGKVKQSGTGFIGRWQGGFRRFLTRLYRHRYLTLLVTLVIVFVTAFLMTQTRQDLFAGEDFTQFFIDIYLPIDTPRKVTNRVTKRFEERLLPLVGNGEVASLSSTVGFLTTDSDWLTQSNLSQVTVDVTEQKEGRKRPIVMIMKEIQELCNDIPGAERVNYRMMSHGPPVDKPVSFRLHGDNYDDMASISNDFKKFLAKYPELYNIDDNFVRGMPELRIVINEERASDLGLNVASIGLYIRNCFDGVEATTFYDEDEEIDVIVRFAEEYRVSIDDIEQIKIPTLDGRLIPFSTVCSLERGTGIGVIKRLEENREITVSADAEDKRNIRAIMADVQREFDEKYRNLYPEISFKLGGEFEEFNVILMDILRLFWIGLLLMYMVLGAQFKSFLQPLIMIFTIPFAFVGCILFLIVSGTPISIVVLYAGVALAGISVNDSIVLISFINGLRAKGMKTAEAVAEGGAVRLRPIILTSVTTIGGLLPMALGLGGYSETWGPMSSTIIFGLFFSTLGTLVVIPCVYGIFDDVTSKFGRRMRLEGE